MTAVKLYSSLKNNTLRTNKLWSWKEADVIVIDDITEDTPLEQELMTAEKFLKIIDNSPMPNEEIRSLIKSKKIIWVLGQKETSNFNWSSMLQTIGVELSAIQTVNLS
ncbi:hypothetical protein OAH12_01155 [Cyclobacteriaceae bacterium]|nr:hypothetical protein [Cyclobacteriaceae bacterium]